MAFLNQNLSKSISIDFYKILNCIFEKMFGIDNIQIMIVSQNKHLIHLNKKFQIENDMRIVFDSHRNENYLIFEDENIFHDF